MPRTAILIAVAVLTIAPRIAALNIEVSDADIDRAVAIAVGPKASAARFHGPYILAVNNPMVERVEVITEFRRFVLASEEQILLGNWMVARGGFDTKGRTIKDILQPRRGQVSIRIRARFHPLHSYSFLPAIDVLIGEPSFLPIDVVRTPLMGEGAPAPMRGAVVETAFNAASLDDRSLPIRIVVDGKELTQVSVDFSTLE